MLLIFFCFLLVGTSSFLLFSSIFLFPLVILRTSLLFTSSSCFPYEVLLFPAILTLGILLEVEAITEAGLALLALGILLEVGAGLATASLGAG